MSLKDKLYLMISILLFIFGFLLGFSTRNLIQKNIKNEYLNLLETNRTAQIPLVAVSTDGKGVLEYGYLKITEGSGKTYISINPFVEPDTQYSFEIAKEFICKYLKVNCSKYDFILEIDSRSILVGGPSAGISFAIGIYCALNNKNVNNLIASTGTIDLDGNIGFVGNIIEKAIAAAENNKKYFFIPKGQSIIYTYEKVEEIKEIFPGFIIRSIKYIPKPINITDEFYKKYNMFVIEVSSFLDLLKYDICL
ncbi:MAG: S16 family serine protease [Nanopusillaceae archaeon]